MDIHSKSGIFVFIMHFLNDKWKPCHVINGFLKTIETSKNAMALQVNEVFRNMGSMFKLLLMPDDGGNFSTMIIALIFVVSCEVLGLAIIFVRTCWGYVMFKCCQHCTNDFKFVMASLLIPSRKYNPFVYNYWSHGPKKVWRCGKSDARHVWLLECPHKSSRL